MMCKALPFRVYHRLKVLSLVSRLTESTFTWIRCKQAGKRQVVRTTSRLADHYGIFKELFPMAYFVPRGHTARQLRPRQLSTSTLWESLDAQRDEHLLDSEGECVHWLVGNIPGGAVTAGEDLSISGPDPCQGYWL
ncbi:39S ribosomal protein L38, mitochondrial-like [Oncorhynchus keta]|uniref:39S ribosomal protein L38, mitochondrial-like n=1 Tax=Oncorhynchus keta TaxID=8018 RepID=UPI0015FA7B70|nr:39S ribosomal protein L38, mitochondrial-like [Oncorhynchus keta]